MKENIVLRFFFFLRCKSFRVILLLRFAIQGCRLYSVHVVRDHPYITSASFRSFLGPPTYVSIISTENQQNNSDPTHPPTSFLTQYMDGLQVVLHSAFKEEYSIFFVVSKYTQISMEKSRDNTREYEGIRDQIALCIHKTQIVPSGTIYKRREETFVQYLYEVGSVYSIFKL